MPGYADRIEDLQNMFLLSESQIVGEQNQKDFIACLARSSCETCLFPSMNLRVRSRFLKETLQDYLGKYQDLRDEWKRKEKMARALILSMILFLKLSLLSRLRSISTIS